ncbi:MAG TPA: lipid-A-disaccharide synthase [Candidatus Binatia bacterium]|nr:lipid-A-disaccharide synthase [Candidatus Binatia bacterium]
MSGKPKKVMIVVGEASGDLHGAHLVRSLCRLDPTLEVFGVGGVGLKREGMKVIFDVARLTGMGLTEIAGNLKAVCEAYIGLRTALKKERPDLLILIDFPEFNLRLARLAKKLEVPVLYYIAPQVWAWRRRRIHKISRWVDQMAVVFPFEVPLYEKEGIRVKFVGHPLLDVVHASRSREATLQYHGLDPSKRTVALLPGSRKQEVDYHLPILLEAADRLDHEMQVQYILVRASTVDRRHLEEMVRQRRAHISISDGDTYNALEASDLAWTASGTATLETALMRRPMIIVYRMSWLTYTLAKLLVRVKYIGLVNIIAGEQVVPELIQTEVAPRRILFESRSILNDAGSSRRMAQKLAQIREKLGSPGAAGRVADMALSMMNWKDDCGQIKQGV